MRLIIQRVTEASVIIQESIKGKIQKGLLILIGIEENDTEQDAEYLAQKSINLRIFSDIEGKMNLSLLDIAGDILLISQFTLYASTKKGNRPSFIKAAKPEMAIPLYQKMIALLEKYLDKPIQTGEFGADMKVNLCNDGPVTIIIDSKIKE
ncbi:MAG: D-tyrosyl-tRNA(Tyr) deacylase [Cytophagia bacterium]|nr:MAG: D-tyrosyl-tRNA(Tyr) deacylase [Cytophagales bacterium]TAG05242.1 MAG: D-tyrosyl-tRNA(Tyr) deacylase [Cytophagia bacterium]TAG43869.1 MAG: D-tyrosyl-tRNA(Tyr) deacylase [Cytophagia bacterium]TAH30142.1 MAG: D-tyrosyl-tRNA(Tyr) deacylase [Cytophagales bacterium]